MRNATLQTVIAARHQSLWGSERRSKYFRYIMAQIKDRREKTQNEPVDCAEYAALTMLRLNSQVRQYDCFTPARRVCGRTPEMPIGAVGNPFNIDLTNPENSSVTHTRPVIAKLREVQKASSENDINGEFNRTSAQHVREMESGDSFSLQALYFYRRKGNNEADLKRHAPRITIARFGRQGGLFFRGNSVDVDINELRHASNIYDVLGCDGPLH